MAKSRRQPAGSAPKSGRDADGPADDQQPITDLRDLTVVHLWQIQAVRDILVVAAALSLVWVGYLLRAVTVPLLVALLLAYLFEPIIERLCKHPKISRTRAVSLLLITAGGTFLIVLALILPLLIAQTTRFMSEVRDGTFRGQVARLGQWVPESQRDDFKAFLNLFPGSALPAPTEGAGDAPGGGDQPATDGAGDASGKGAEPPAATAGEDHQVELAGDDDPPLTLTRSGLDELIDQRLAQRLEPGQDQLAGESADWLELARGSADTIFRIIGTVVQIGLVAFLIPFYFFFFSLWYPAVVRFGRNLIPTANRERTLALLKEMDKVVAGFVRGRIVISLIMGGLLAIGWMICGVPYAIPLGVVVGIFCAVPYLGVVGIPAAIGLLFFEQLDGGDMAWWQVILFPVLVFIIVQLIEGYVLIPLIAGKVTNLDPVTIIVAVLAGGSVMGIYGMLLAIPLTACGKILFMQVLLPRIRAWTRGEARDPLPIGGKGGGGERVKKG